MSSQERAFRETHATSLYKEDGYIWNEVEVKQEPVPDLWENIDKSDSDLP